MPKALFAEVYPDFKTAARRARRISTDLKRWTCIVRHRHGWGILVAHETLMLLTLKHNPFAYSETYESKSIGPRPTEATEEIGAEMLSYYMNRWEESEECGWFYGDN